MSRYVLDKAEELFIGLFTERSNSGQRIIGNWFASSPQESL